jgi:hypothetical protein
MILVLLILKLASTTLRMKLFLRTDPNLNSDPIIPEQIEPRNKNNKRNKQILHHVLSPTLLFLHNFQLFDLLIFLNRLMVLNERWWLIFATDCAQDVHSELGGKYLEILPD